MKEEILRMIQDDLGYYHSVDCSYTDPLFIVEKIFHDLPGYILPMFFDEAEIGDGLLGNSFGKIKKIGTNRALISIYNIEDEEGPDYEYEIDIDRLLKLLKEYRTVKAPGPDEIFFKKMGEEISVLAYYKK